MSPPYIQKNYSHFQNYFVYSPSFLFFYYFKHSFLERRDFVPDNIPKYFIINAEIFMSKYISEI
jgi:hypothetical protein